MKIYNFQNATICVYGEVSKERLRKATINLIKQSYTYRKDKGGLPTAHGNYNTSRNIGKK